VRSWLRPHRGIAHEKLPLYLVYAFVARQGFLVGNGLLLGLIANNMADTWLHVVMALVALALGCVVQDRNA